MSEWVSAKYKEDETWGTVSIEKVMDSKTGKLVLETLQVLRSFVALDIEQASPQSARLLSAQEERLENVGNRLVNEIYPSVYLKTQKMQTVFDQRLEYMKHTFLSEFKLWCVWTPEPEPEDEIDRVTRRQILSGYTRMRHRLEREFIVDVVTNILKHSGNAPNISECYSILSTAGSDLTALAQAMGETRRVKRKRERESRQ